MFKKRTVFSLMFILFALYGCGEKAPELSIVKEDIMGDINPNQFNGVTRTIEDLKFEEERSTEEELIYSFIKIEEHIDDVSALYSPSYKQLQPSYAQYTQDGDSWSFSSISTDGEPTYEYIDEPDVSELVRLKFPAYEIKSIWENELNKETGTLHYVIELKYDGQHFSKITKATFDMQLTARHQAENPYEWTSLGEPTYEDVSFDGSNLLGRWVMKGKNGYTVSLTINDISNGEISVDIYGSNAILDSDEAKWIGIQNKTNMDMFESDKYKLNFYADEDFLTFNNNRFYKVN